MSPMFPHKNEFIILYEIEIIEWYVYVFLSKEVYSGLK